MKVFVFNWLKGFLAWDFTEGTFNRERFHSVMIEKILPHLNPWPLPNSLVILDNARIHMFFSYWPSTSH